MPDDSEEFDSDDLDTEGSAANPQGKEKLDEEIKKKIHEIIKNVAEDAISLLFHTPDDEGYADIRVAGHRETWKVRSKTFKQFFRRQCWKNGIALNAEELRQAINLFEARAQFDGPEIEVYLRVAALRDEIWIDLGGRDWKAVKITLDGWQIVTSPKVRFHRERGMEALPEPTRGATVQALRRFLNVRTDDEFLLVVAFVLGALRGRKPYPVLVLVGEQGTAKSSLVRFIRGFVDPSSVPLLAPPATNRDLFIAARNSFFLAFDNLSRLSPELSDSLARISTGGGIRLRTLYTDTDETLINVARPQVLNGIYDFVTREDLQDRSIILALQPITEQQRRTEADLIDEFSLEQPSIFGAFLDRVVTGLRKWPEVKLANSPRMADWARWCVACGLDGFLDAIETNQMNAIQVMLEADPLAIGMRALGKRHDVWQGTATELMEVLAGVGYLGSESSSALSGSLRKVAPHLRKVSANAALFVGR
jgi:hypothetical protein